MILFPPRVVERKELRAGHRFLLLFVNSDKADLNRGFGSKEVHFLKSLAISAN
jgi:hypothetical protein